MLPGGPRRGMGCRRRRGPFTIGLGVGVLLELLGALLAILGRAAGVVPEHTRMGPLDAAGRAALHGPHLPSFEGVSDSSRALVRRGNQSRDVRRGNGTRKCLGGGFSRTKPPPGPADPSQFTSFPRVLLRPPRPTIRRTSPACCAAARRPSPSRRPVARAARIW